MDNKYSDCFAQKCESCKVLTEKLCETKSKCPFYKTQEEYDKGFIDRGEENAVWTRCSKV